MTIVRSTDVLKILNHEPFADDELRLLPQNRHISEEVKQKILFLNQHGVRTCDQIIFLIQNDYSPELQASLTKLDVQKLLQQHTNRKFETHEFVSLLTRKRNDG